VSEKFDPETQYIHYKIPRSVIVVIITCLVSAVCAFSFGTIIQLVSGTDWLIDGEMTAFAWGACIGLIPGMIGLVVSFVAFLVCPKEIRSKSDPAYNKLWPPWDE
jgi:hypothetical protein